MVTVAEHVAGDDACGRLHDADGPGHPFIPGVTVRTVPRFFVDAAN